MAQKIHSSIRLSGSEKEFLDKIGISILSVTRIGFASLACVAQTDPLRPCIYLANTGKNRTLPAGPHIKALNPLAQCCPACPIWIGLAKRYLTAHCHGMNDPALNPSLIVQDPSPSPHDITAEDRCASEPAPVVMCGAMDIIDELLEEETLEEETVPPVAHELKPAGHAAAIERIPVERILNVSAASSRPAPSPAPVSTPALDREIMDRLKRERASS